jgi:hypothetical protein
VRILRIRASEQYATFIFRFCPRLIVDDIDPWITCVWFA